MLHLKIKGPVSFTSLFQTIMTSLFLWNTKVEFFCKIFKCLKLRLWFTQAQNTVLSRFIHVSYFLQ